MQDSDARASGLNAELFHNAAISSNTVWGLVSRDGKGIAEASIAEATHPFMVLTCFLNYMHLIPAAILAICSRNEETLDTVLC